MNYSNLNCFSEVSGKEAGLVRLRCLLKQCIANKKDQMKSPHAAADAPIRSTKVPSDQPGGAMKLLKLRTCALNQPLDRWAELSGGSFDMCLDISGPKMENTSKSGLPQRLAGPSESEMLLR